jgi:MFS family permease
MGSGLPATFWWLWAGMLLNAVATFVFAFLALFLTARGFTAGEAGLVASLFGAGSLLSGPLAGYCADRAGRRPTMLVSLLSSALLTALLAFLDSRGAIAAAVLLLGFATPAFRPAAAATIADVVAGPERQRAFGLSYWAANLGMAISLTVGGALAERGYGPLFLADAGTTLVFVALIWSRVPETRPAATSDAPASAGGREGYGAVLADRVFLSFVGVQLALLLAFLQFQVAAPLDMAAHGLGPGAFGRVMAVNGLLIVLVQPLAARFTRRFDSAHLLAAAALLIGLGYGAYALCSSAWQFAGATALWSLGEILTFPVAATLVAELAPAHLRGRYQGLYGMMWGAALILAPALGAALYERAGARAVWIACLGVCLAAAGGHLAIGGARRRRSRPA